MKLIIFLRKKDFSSSSSNRNNRKIKCSDSTQRAVKIIGVDRSAFFLLPYHFRCFYLDTLIHTLHILHNHHVNYHARYSFTCLLLLTCKITIFHFFLVLSMCRSRHNVKRHWEYRKSIIWSPNSNQYWIHSHSCPILR